MSQQKNETPAFSLQKFGANEWKFVYSESLTPLITQFNKAAEDLTLDNSEQALKLFEALKKQLPQYMDIYHVIALIHMWRKNYEEAIAVLESGIRTITALFPTEFFDNEDSLLEWTTESNRPFLNSLITLGLSLAYTKRYTDAVEIFEQTLIMNPDDHQGIRNLVLWGYLEEDRIDAALDFCIFYQDDTLPAISYSNALVLFKQGNIEQAELQLSSACEFYPDIAKALIKIKSSDKNYDFMGLFEKPDDSKMYVKHYGHFWHETKDALTFLEKIFVE